MSGDKLNILLSQLEEISWGEIYDINGPINDNVRDIIMDLISSNKTVRDAAYWRLDNHMVVQSSLSESCFFILPFLNELLKIVEYKDRLLDIIFEIINGSDIILNGYINVNYSVFNEPFYYFKKDQTAKPRRLKVKYIRVF